MCSFVNYGCVVGVAVWVWLWSLKQFSKSWSLCTLYIYDVITEKVYLSVVVKCLGQGMHEITCGFPNLV